MTAPPGMVLPPEIKSSVTQFPLNESIIPAFGALGWEDQAYLSVRVNDLPPADAPALLQGAHPLSLEDLTYENEIDPQALLTGGLTDTGVQKHYLISL